MHRTPDEQLLIRQLVMRTVANDVFLSGRLYKRWKHTGWEGEESGMAGSGDVVCGVFEGVEVDVSGGRG